MLRRTRIKICGLTRVEDVQQAVAAGIDAIGFVFYAKSPRYVTPDMAAELITAATPFVTTVGLFVNAPLEEIEQVVAQTPISILQFHGDETLEQCCAAAKMVNRPFLRAIRVHPDAQATDLLKCERNYHTASKLFQGLLLDTFTDDGYGGSGKIFDWSLIPKELARRVVLSGGLSAQNVADAILRVRPCAVDISSGVELAKGVKDVAKIRAFVEAVHHGDAGAKSINERIS